MIRAPSRPAKMLSNTGAVLDVVQSRRVSVAWPPVSGGDLTKMNEQPALARSSKTRGRILVGMLSTTGEPLVEIIATKGIGDG
jgi:hypothetical protein